MFAGGVLKGIVGIALPAFLIGTMSIFLPPREVVLIILLPIMFSNFRQAFQGEPVLSVVWRYRILAVCSCITIAIVASFASTVRTDILLLLAGCAVILFGFVGLSGAIPHLPSRFDGWGQGVTGVLSGVLGGLTAMWGPPIAMYLMARDVPKAQFVQATGLLFSVSSVFMMAGIFVGDELTWGVIAYSAAMVPAVFAGIKFGEWIRGYLDHGMFYRAVLVVFILIGLNLIRKAVFG